MEVESGRRDNRPQLAAALALCRQTRAVLVIVKLDSLARSVAFISNLTESGVEFVAVNMPQANRLTLHILAAVASHEREMISQRTHVAQVAAKGRGTRPGNVRPDMENVAVVASQQVASFRAAIRPLVQSRKAKGRSPRAIAGELYNRGVRSGVEFARADPGRGVLRASGEFLSRSEARDGRFRQ